MIKTDDIYFSYDNNENTAVLNGISLEIKEGEFVAILGHNGSGKSTLAKTFNGIILPQKGTVSVNGMDTKETSDAYDIRKTVGMVFQNPDNQIVATVVEEDVAFGPENLGLPSEEIRERVDTALRAVDMYACKNNAPHMLSGGQKQRVAVAGVLAMEPEYMIFDESTAMLDPVGRKEILETAVKLNREKKITIIMITHYMEEAALADRVIVLKAGKIILDAPPREVFSKVSLMKELNLGVPQSTEVYSYLEEKGIKFEKVPLNPTEFMEELKKVI